LKRLIFILILLLPLAIFSQKKDFDGYVVYAEVVDGDTLPMVSLREVEIYSFHFTSKRKAKKITKLIRNVKKVYPYAKLAGIKLDEYEVILAGIDNDKERKQVIKQVEKDLKNEFEDDLRNMTFSQGKILIKLVDRETGDSSYQLVKELRGNFSAFFYQAFAKIFGFNLKTKYDPEGEDKEIETIVRMIESGQI